MSHASTNARPALIKRVKMLVLESVSLKNIEKGRILQQLDGLSDEKLQKMEALFLKEQKTKDSLLKQRFKENPELAQSHNQKLYKIGKKAFLKAEALDRAKEQLNLDNILNEIPE